MIENKVRLFFEKVIEDLVRKYSFDTFILNGTSNGFYNWQKKAFGKCETGNVWYESTSGATKGVIIVKYQFGKDYVIKVPFNNERGCSIPDETYTSHLVSNFNKDYHNFTKDDYKETIDYCKKEAILTQILETDFSQIRQCFAGTYFLGYFYGYPFYISERVRVCQKDVEKYYAHEQRYNSEEGGWTGSYIFCTPCSVAAASSSRVSWSTPSDCGRVGDNIAIDNLFGNFLNWQDFDELSLFINEMNINDIHVGNVGFDFKTNLPVILDYSGYFE